MSLEQFKTQVLLLHSEQSTLDSLSTGFTDRYTVHCATSGSEALNTLGETQIDVIVSAQDLPGMSGLDALREAKKRSPETIGILLAGSGNDDLEALVGDKEVFQVVRGTVTPESLRSLIDNATRQTRLLALADSANDTTANVDEPVSEHIVMETSANGSTIISDGTGEMPVLNPDKISAAANIGSQAVDVLVLTKDEEFLATVKDSAHGMHNVIYANTLAQADEAVRKNPVGVAVVDAAMLGDNVEKITVHLRKSSPRLVAIVAGRRDDGEMLMNLINRGKVYRFLLKPVSPGRARLAIEASVKHHMEAPDSAFKTPGQAAPAAAATAKPVPPPKPKEPKADAPKKAAEAKPEPIRPVKDDPPILPSIEVEPRPVPDSHADDSISPIDYGLADAFGSDDSSFTETVTGLVKSVGRSLSSDKSKAEAPVVAERKASSSGGSAFTQPKFIGMGAAAVVVLLAIGWWVLGGSDESVPAPAQEPVARVPAEAPAISETERAEPAPAPAEPDASIDDLVAEARLAATAGQVFNPPGSNAIELYLAAAAIAPGNAEVAAELAATIDQALSMAESSLLNRRAEDAEAALRLVGLADPDNARLPFLTAQLEQIQLRNLLDDARAAIRESRYEDASAAINAARGFDLDDTAEIDTISAELEAALGAERIDDVVEKANARLAEGKLTSPSNDNARYYFELALSNDPQNTVARQGLAVVASKLIIAAREQIDSGDFNAADLLLADARRLDPSSNELAATTTALADARNRKEQQRLAAIKSEADAKAAAAKAVADRAARERAAAARAAAAKAEAEAEAERQAAADKLAQQQKAANDAAASAAANAAANSDGGGTALPTNGDPVAQAPVEERMNFPSPVAASSLTRTKYVAPKYPRAAERRGLSGWVDVLFTVDIDGTVKQVVIRDSNPGETFVRAATNAVEGWEFEPVIENGVAVERTAAIRLMFAIE